MRLDAEADDPGARGSPTGLTRRACYRALQARDARFDGRIFVGVLTTGIYCRPVCPAKTPKLENVVFYPSAAAAQEAGFRPCLRCRPETSPELATWRGTENTVGRALALIAQGAFAGGEGDVETLALRLGVGSRHLRRLFHEHLGASPLAIAHTRRVLFAKQLIHETDMRLSDVAMAAGFGSVRSFNATFERLFSRPPSSLRRTPSAGRAGAAVKLTLAYAPPYDWDAIIDFLGARAIPGVEVVEPQRYMRTIALGGRQGVVEIEPLGGRHALRATIRTSWVEGLVVIVARIRRVFDLGADIGAITEHLTRDSALAKLVRLRPGLRVPGAWDGFELAVRAVLGQQITVTGARKLAAEVVARWGEPLSPALACAGLTHVFPSPDALAATDLSSLGMPGSRRHSLRAVAAAAAHDPTTFEGSPQSNLDAAIARLRSIAGIGEWTAQYIALRALRDPDAFPASDVGLLRAAADRSGRRPTPAALLARSEAWRPWRAYAAQHLWTADSDE